MVIGILPTYCLHPGPILLDFLSFPIEFGILPYIKFSMIVKSVKPINCPIPSGIVPDI